MLIPAVRPLPPPLCNCAQTGVGDASDVATSALKLIGVLALSGLALYVVLKAIPEAPPRRSRAYQRVPGILNARRGYVE